MVSIRTILVTEVRAMAINIMAGAIAPEVRAKAV